MLVEKLLVPFSIDNNLLRIEKSPVLTIRTNDGKNQVTSFYTEGIIPPEPDLSLNPEGIIPPKTKLSLNLLKVQTITFSYKDVASLKKVLDEGNYSPLWLLAKTYIRSKYIKDSENFDGSRALCIIHAVIQVLSNAETNTKRLFQVLLISQDIDTYLYKATVNELVNKGQNQTLKKYAQLFLVEKPDIQLGIEIPQTSNPTEKQLALSMILINKAFDAGRQTYAKGYNSSVIEDARKVTPKDHTVFKRESVGKDLIVTSWFNSREERKKKILKSIYYFESDIHDAMSELAQVRGKITHSFDEVRKVKKITRHYEIDFSIPSFEFSFCLVLDLHEMKAEKDTADLVIEQEKKPIITIPLNLKDGLFPIKPLPDKIETKLAEKKIRIYNLITRMMHYFDLSKKCVHYPPTTNTLGTGV
jgi:hypothetical protein